MRMLIIFLATLVAAPALAWEASSLTDVRFSPDGRYFSFVEYGEPDADEGGYASFYIVDTELDRWVAGTPIRIELSGEGANERKALSAVRTKAAPLVRKLDLRDAGRAAVPLIEVDRFDPYKPVRRSVAVPALNGAMIALDERRAKAAHFCSEDYHVPADFRLTLKAQGKSLVLADYVGRLPRSRGCTTHHDISAVYVHRSSGRTVLATLVGLYLPGWEGHDRRLLAVTKILP